MEESSFKELSSELHFKINCFNISIRDQYEYTIIDKYNECLSWIYILLNCTDWTVNPVLNPFGLR